MKTPTTISEINPELSTKELEEQHAQICGELFEKSFDRRSASKSLEDVGNTLLFIYTLKKKGFVITRPEAAFPFDTEAYEHADPLDDLGEDSADLEHPDNLVSKQAEIERLRAEVARLKAACDKWSEEDILYPRVVSTQGEYEIPKEAPLHGEEPKMELDEVTGSIMPL